MKTKESIKESFCLGLICNILFSNNSHDFLLIMTDVQKTYQSPKYAEKKSNTIIFLEDTGTMHNAAQAVPKSKTWQHTKNKSYFKNIKIC